MSRVSRRSATPNACPRTTRQRSWEERCRKSTSGSATVPPKRASLWRATDSAVLGEFRKRAVIDRQCLDARAPAPFADQLLHVGADLVETREPDAALAAHIVKQFERRLESREPAGQSRMPHRNPQPAEFPGGVELGAEHLHRPLWCRDRHAVAEITVVGVMREVVERPV